MNTNRPVEEVVCDMLKHIARLEDRVEDLENDMSRIVPNKDYDGHSMYHQLLIDKERRKAQLQDSIIEKSLSGIIWAVVVVLSYAAWNYLKMEIKK